MNRDISLRNLKVVLLTSMVILSGVFLPASAYSDACEPDRAKYCPTFRNDDPLRYYCLKGVSSQLKAACKAQLRDVSGSEEDFIDECYDDYMALCSQVPTGKGKVLKCLKSNSTKLSFECRKRVVVFPSR